jgi:hypothetical protein
MLCQFPYLLVLLASAIARPTRPLEDSFIKLPEKEPSIRELHDIKVKEVYGKEYSVLKGLKMVEYKILVEKFGDIEKQEIYCKNRNELSEKFEEIKDAAHKVHNSKFDLLFRRLKADEDEAMCSMAYPTRQKESYADRSRRKSIEAEEFQEFSEVDLALAALFRSLKDEQEYVSSDVTETTIIKSDMSNEMEV